ncbi:hypothetical protein [Vibrio campbellii]|uniref:Uncharacterized protein n=1 Tax=Vibrio campbellii TaxID=680 RepID=A0ABY5IBN1_9VIBR|nr:hypothetical protein [Vibrio campbellii]UTZ21885.1 hypothetical protein HB760_08140 [Vibrio campbellii]UTZ30705.1 hypothetical protein HB762_04465 [Vibrio campbellii]
MSEVNTEDSLVRFRYAQKLIDGRDEFANQNLIEPTGQPSEPFMQVTDDIISIRDARHDIRSVYLIPVVVVVWFLFIFILSDLGLNSASINYGKEKLIRYQEKEQNGGYFDDYDLRDYSYYKTIFSNNGDYSLVNYFFAVYKFGHEGAREGLKRRLEATGVTALIAFLVTVFFIRTLRPTDIFFDRKRGIVYTWFYGRVAACRFENLGFLEKSSGIVLYLYAEKKKGKDGYDMLPITIQPTRKVILNTARDNNDFFQQIFNFMENGKSAVITGEQFYRPQPKTYFMIDKKPEPFEERLEKLLEREHELPKLYRYLQE